MADERIVIDVSQALADIAKLKGGMVDVQAQAAKTGNAIENALDNDAAHGVADAVNGLQKEFDDLKKSADILKNALKGATDPAVIKLYTKSIAQLEKGMDELSKTGKAAGVNLEKANKEAGTGKQVFENFFGAFTKVALITAAISAVVKFVKYAVDLSSQIKVAKKSIEGFTGSAEEADKIVNSLVETGQKNFISTANILKAGKALLAFGEDADNLPDVLTRIADISGATGKNFNELTTIYGKARTAGVLMAEDINQLTDAGIPIVAEFAKQFGVSADQVKKLGSEGKISFAELELAFFNLTEADGKFAGQAKLNAEGVSGAWDRMVNSMSGVITLVGDGIGDFLSGIINKITDSIDAVKKFGQAYAAYLNTGGATGAFFTIDDGGDDDAAAKLKKKAELEAAAAAERAKFAAKAADANAKRLQQIEDQRQQAILAGMKDGVEKEIAQENYRFSELIRQLKRFHLDTSEAEEQHADNIAAIRQREADRAQKSMEFALKIRQQIWAAALKAEEDAANSKEADRSKQQADLKVLLDLKNQEVEIQEQAGIRIINGLIAQGKSEAEIKEAEKALDLEVQKARLQNQLEFEIAMLETIGQGDDARLQEVINNIDIIRGKIANLGGDSQGAEKPKSLLERLGLSREQIDAMGPAVQEVIGYLNQLTAANVANAEAQLQASQEKVSAAKTALDEEKALAAEGYANNVTLKQKELADAQADEAKALAQKKSAQKQQIALDTAMQLSSLITSAANILKGWSTIPFVGQVLGIAAIAAMFTAFAATRAKALQATKFKHGGSGRVDGNSIIVGASHDDGGVGIEAEGGEYFGTDGKRFGIVNKKMTTKHFDLLAAVNKDDKGGMALALSRITGGAMDRTAVDMAIGAGSGSSVSIGGIDKETKTMLKDWKSKSLGGKIITIEGNFRVEREGGHTRKIRIS